MSNPIKKWWRMIFTRRKSKEGTTTQEPADRWLRDARKVLEGYNAEIQAMTGSTEYTGASRPLPARKKGGLRER